MKYLTADYWKAFKKSNEDVFNGKKFEDLISQLLKEKFNGQWIATQDTWDGGKDFFQKEENKLNWAECKIYKNNIDIKTIGKTLVMVIIQDNIDKLYFFSYSPLVSTAHEHLAQFSKNSNINIIVYDDEKLEELLLNTIETKKLYFDTFKQKNLTFDSKDIIYMNISKDYDTSILEVENVDKKKDRKANFLHNQTFMLEVIIINNSIKQKEYDINFEKFNSSKIKLWFLSKLDGDVKNIKLLGCQVKSINLYLKARDIGLTIIPPICIKSKQDDKSELFYTKEEEIKVNFITYPNLVGGRIETILMNFETNISTNNELVLYVVTGHSGVGKTRLGSEFVDLLLKQNYSIFKYDCHSLNHFQLSKFLQKTLSFLYKIPINNNLIEEPFTLLNNLINGTCKIDELILDDIVKLLITGIKKYRISILIDNLQSFESLAFKLISKLYKFLYNLKLQSSLILIINEDELALNSSAILFYKELENDNRSNLINLKEFTPTEAKQFINNLIKIKNEEKEIRFTDIYPEITKLIFKHIGYKALNLFQTILYLSNEDIISIKNEYFLVRNIHNFNQAIVGLNKNIESILEKRYKYLGKEPRYIFALKYISFFEELNTIDIETIPIKEDIDKLIQFNFLKEDNNTISFYHDSIKKYMYSTKFWLEKSIIEQVLKDIDTFYNDYEITYFISQLLIDEDKNIIQKVYDYFLYNNIVPNFQTNLFAQILIKKLHKNIKDQFVDNTIELKLINLILPSLFFNINLEEKVSMLKNIYEHRFNKFDKYKESYKELSLILREYSAWSCQLNNAKAGYIALESFIKKLESLNLKTIEMYRVKADMKNRQCVNLKFLGKYEDAELKGIESLEITKKYNLKTEECLNYIDLGYIYFGCNKDSSKLIKYWRSAVQNFNRYEEEICKYNMGMKYAGKLITAHLMVLNKDKNSFSYISDMISLCKNDYEDYYLKQSILLDIVNNFMQKKFINLSNKINRIKDLSIATNETKFYIKGLYAESKYYYFKNNFEMSLEILNKILYHMDNINEEFINSNYCLVSDYIRLCKQLNDKGYIDKILQISDLNEDDFLNSKTTFLVDGINLPNP